MAAVTQDAAVRQGVAQRVALWVVCCGLGVALGLMGLTGLRNYAVLEDEASGLWMAVAALAFGIMLLHIGLMGAVVSDVLRRQHSGR